MLKITNESLEKLGDWLLSLAVLIQYPLTLLQSLFVDSGLLTEEKAGMMRVLGSVLAVLFSFTWVIKRKLIVAFSSYSIFILLFVISGLLQFDNIEYIMSEGMRFTLCTSIPIFLSFIAINNLNIFFKSALYLSLFCALIAFIYIQFYLTGEMVMMESIYNMSLGYALLFPTLYFMYYRTFYFNILAFLLVIVILIAGSRGPLIPIFIFFILQKFILGTIKDKLGLIILGVLLVSIFPFVIDLLDIWGINSRTLSMLAEGIADSDSGRSDIYRNVIMKIVESPLCGYGVFADRVFVGGVYCHNLFLELLVDFGCIIAPILVLIFTVYVIFLMRWITNMEQRFLILLLLLAIPPLLVSSSYLIDFRLPLFLGYIYFLSKKYFIFKWF